METAKICPLAGIKPRTFQSPAAVVTDRPGPQPVHVLVEKKKHKQFLTNFYLYCFQASREDNKRNKQTNKRTNERTKREKENKYCEETTTKNTMNLRLKTYFCTIRMNTNELNENKISKVS